MGHKRPLMDDPVHFSEYRAFTFASTRELITRRRIRSIRRGSFGLMAPGEGGERAPRVWPERPRGMEVSFAGIVR
jgi:hypothetical protein